MDVHEVTACPSCLIDAVGSLQELRRRVGEISPLLVVVVDAIDVWLVLLKGEHALVLARCLLGWTLLLELFLQMDFLGQFRSVVGVA